MVRADTNDSGAADRAEDRAGRLRAIVFDFDGVILESTDIKTDAFCALFSDLDPALQSRVREHHLANLGISRFVKFEWIYQNLLGRPLHEAERLQLGERFTAIALRKVLDCPFVPGAEAALRALSPRYPLFVASGTPQAELDQIVLARGLGGYFAEVWGSPSEKHDILADIGARYRLDRRQILFIGDGSSDERAARAAGVEFLARVAPTAQEAWSRSGARRAADLTSLVDLVATW